MFSNLFNSSRMFHKRWDDRALTKDGIVRAFKEEVEEVLEWLELDDDNIDPNELLHEMCDVLVTMIGIGIYFGISLFQWNTGMREIAHKNDKKNHDTHYVDEHDKIRRRK